MTNKLGFSTLATVLDAILDFSARDHLYQFMPGVSHTTGYEEHFGIRFVIPEAGSRYVLVITLPCPMYLDYNEQFRVHIQQLTVVCLSTV